MAASLKSRVRSHRSYSWLVLVTVASGMIMAILNSSIVGIALPAISIEFGSSITTTAWIATIYMIIQATFMPVSGRAGDIFGHKRIYLAGLVVFTAMSLVAAFAWNVHVLIAVRGLMAIGTSALSPMSLAFVMQAFPGRERAQALGVMGGLMGFAPALGLVSGGLLVETLGWRSVFFVAVPLCALIAPLAWLVLEETQAQSRPRGFDVPGSVLLTAGLFAGLLALSQGSGWGWGDARTLAGLAVFAVLFLLFILRERAARGPLIDLGLFRFRSLVSANVVGFFASGAMFGSFVLLPFFFQSVLGGSPAAAGLKIAPLALAFLLSAPLGGRLTTRAGARATALAGLLVAAAGYAVASQVMAVEVSTAALGIAIAVMGAGLGLANAPVTTAALSDVPPDKRGVASSLPQMSRFIGGSFGMAVVGAVLASRVTAHLVAAGVPAAQAAGVSSAGTAALAADPLTQVAYASAFQDVFLFTVLLLAAAMVAAAFVPRLREE